MLYISSMSSVFLALRTHLSLRVRIVCILKWVCARILLYIQQMAHRTEKIIFFHQRQQYVIIVLQKLAFFIIVVVE